MDVAEHQVPMHIDGVREGDLIAYPGPPRRQALADFFGVGLAHIGVAVRTADTLSVVEIDFKGIRTRSLRAIVRHYPKVEALRLPICDHESKRIAQRALEGLGDKRPYAHNLARFGFVWANLRSIQHPHVEYWSRALFPFAAAQLNSSLQVPIQHVLVYWFSMRPACCVYPRYSG